MKRVSGIGVLIGCICGTHFRDRGIDRLCMKHVSEIGVFVRLCVKHVSDIRVLIRVLSSCILIFLRPFVSSLLM